MERTQHMEWIAIRCPRCREQFTTAVSGDKFRTYCRNERCTVQLLVMKKGRKGNKWKVKRI